MNTFHDYRVLQMSSTITNSLAFISPFISIRFDNISQSSWNEIMRLSVQVAFCVQAAIVHQWIIRQTAYLLLHLKLNQRLTLIQEWQTGINYSCASETMMCNYQPVIKSVARSILLASIQFYSRLPIIRLPIIRLSSNSSKIRIFHIIFIR